MRPFLKNSLLALVLLGAFAKSGAGADPVAMWARDLSQPGSKTVLVKMSPLLNLSALEKEIQPGSEASSDPTSLKIKKIAGRLESHLMEQIKTETPWILDPKSTDIDEVTPLWLVGAVRIRGKASAVEKLLITKGASRLTLERAKPVQGFMDEVSPTTKIDAPSSLEQGSTGWGVRKMGAPEAWEKGVKGEGVIVAVLDSGVNVNHPDLAGNVWKNSGEEGIDKEGNDRSSNGIDDDGNGYIDDVYGWNFEENNNEVSDFVGHGTQAAGLIAGQGSLGVQTGVAPKAKVMALRTCCQLGGEIAESAIWEAVQYAMKQGARVISMSVSMKHWGKPNYVQWRRASEILNLAGVVHVNSAGNRGQGNEPYNIGAPGSNPPAWLHPLQPQTGEGLSSMITVGAVDFEDHIRNYSSRGPVTWEQVQGYLDFPVKKGGLIKPDVCGPSEVPSLSSDGKNYTLSFGGTSSATPQIAGVVALLMSDNLNLTVAQITESLQMTATPVEGEFTNRCGAGRVNVGAALEYSRRHFK